MTAYDKIRLYINHHPILTLGTINPDGTPHGAIIYACADSDRHSIYFITKLETQKCQNLIARDQVSMTIVDPTENSTLQANGRAHIIKDVHTIDTVMKKLTHVHAAAVDWLPPIAKLHAGAYVIVGVEISSARLAEFEGMTIGDAHIFTRA